MGKVKDWLLTENYCCICGRGFVPAAVNHKVSISYPTCSVECLHAAENALDELADRNERIYEGDRYSRPRSTRELLRSHNLSSSVL